MALCGAGIAGCADDQWQTGRLRARAPRAHPPLTMLWEVPTLLLDESCPQPGVLRGIPQSFSITNATPHPRVCCSWCGVHRQQNKDPIFCQAVVTVPGAVFISVVTARDKTGNSFPRGLYTLVGETTQKLVVNACVHPPLKFLC